MSKHSEAIVWKRRRNAWRKGIERDFKRLHVNDRALPSFVVMGVKVTLVCFATGAYLVHLWLR